MVTVEAVLDVVPALSIAVALAYYGLQIRNQNKARQTQLYMQMTDKFCDPDQLEARSKFASLEWSTAEEYMEIWNSPEGRRIIGTLGAYFEGLGVLVKEKLLDIRIVALLMTGNLTGYWEKHKPMIGEIREAINWPRAFIETEYLYNELMKYLEDHPEHNA